MKVLAILYWISVYALVHSYFIYPLYRWYRSRKILAGKSDSQEKRTSGEGSKRISVILSAFNEEACILDKLENLFEYLNNDRLYPHDPLIKLAITHYQFEAIHPFRDGNGRTGRILAILLLLQKRLLDDDLKNLC